MPILISFMPTVILLMHPCEIIQLYGDERKICHQIPKSVNWFLRTHVDSLTYSDLDFYWPWRLKYIIFSKWNDAYLLTSPSIECFIAFSKQSNAGSETSSYCYWILNHKWFSFERKWMFLSEWSAYSLNSLVVTIQCRLALRNKPGIICMNDGGVLNNNIIAGSE